MHVAISYSCAVVVAGKFLKRLIDSK